MVAATPSITLCAALSSRRGGQLPASLLATTYGDTTGMSAAVIFAWIVLWPVLAAVIGAAPVSLAVARGTHAVRQLLAALIAVPLALLAGLSREAFAP